MMGFPFLNIVSYKQTDINKSLTSQNILKLLNLIKNF